MKKYKEGQVIHEHGSKYIVEKEYEVSDSYMKEHGLEHKNRVTLRKLEGENGLETMDFANVKL